MICTLLLAALTSPTALLFTVPPILAAPAISATGDAESAADSADGVDWFQDGYSRALRRARKLDSLVFLAFVPGTSDYSQKVVAETFPDERVRAELTELVCLRFEDVENRAFEKVRNQYNVETYPTFVLVNPDGSIEDRIEGFIPADPMVDQLQRIKAGTGTVSWHRAEVAAEPDELEHQFSLAQMLENVRAYDDAELTYDAIRSADPRGETTAGARLAMNAVWDELRESSGDDQANWDLEPIYAHMTTVPAGPAAFQGWTSVGNFQASIEGRLADAADAFMSGWEHVTDNSRRGWARGVANFLVTNGGESLDARHQIFAIDLANVAVAEAQRECDAHVTETGTTESEDGGDYESFVAGHVAVLVRCQQAFGHMEDAVVSARRCTELDPENEEYAELLEQLVAQR
jgi:hypothetical protein